MDDCKELQRVGLHGLDWYDYGVRNYDAAKFVWITILNFRG